jgi:hypothetical protein
MWRYSTSARRIRDGKDGQESEGNKYRRDRRGHRQRAGSVFREATDGEIGHVEDFLVDDRIWAIRYVVVDTRNWWPGRKVLISPEWIKRVSWPDSRVYVDLTREGVKASPEYDPDRPLERDYESRLYRHYGRRSYWE